MAWHFLGIREIAMHSFWHALRAERTRITTQPTLVSKKLHLETLQDTIKHLHQQTVKHNAIFVSKD